MVKVHGLECTYLRCPSEIGGFSVIEGRYDIVVMALPDQHQTPAEEARMKHLAIVVDDDAASRFIYDRILRSLNFEVLQAGDGATAIELLSTRKPDFLLVDLLLPRINGLQVLEYAHQAAHLDQMRIAIITAHSDFRSSYDLGHNEAFLLKPVTATMLRDVARQAILSSEQPS